MPADRGCHYGTLSRALHYLVFFILEKKLYLCPRRAPVQHGESRLGQHAAAGHHERIQRHAKEMKHFSPHQPGDRKNDKDSQRHFCRTPKSILSPSNPSRPTPSAPRPPVHPCILVHLRGFNIFVTQVIRQPKLLERFVLSWTTQV